MGPRQRPLSLSRLGVLHAAWVVLLLAIARASEGKAATSRCSPNWLTHGAVLVFQRSLRQVGDGKVAIVNKRVGFPARGELNGAS